MGPGAGERLFPASFHLLSSKEKIRSSCKIRAQIFTWRE